MDLMRAIEGGGRSSEWGRWVARDVRMGEKDLAGSRFRSTLRTCLPVDRRGFGTRGGDWCCAGLRRGRVLVRLVRWC